MEKEEIIRRARHYIAREQDPHFRGEVEQLLEEDNTKELEDRFYRDLEFGTGGLRGIIGGGYNRMNALMVKSATQGLANYLRKAFPRKAAFPKKAAFPENTAKPGTAGLSVPGSLSAAGGLSAPGGLSAAIAFDSRHYSADFAEAAALIFAANGIKAYLFSAMRPTPELSFAIRLLGCDTGIVVTASHNPPQYNGYKAYWNDGAQVIPPHDRGIILEVNAVSEIKEITREEALAAGLLQIIDKEVDEPYQAMVKSRLFRPDLIKAKAGEVKIVYTPLHGTGALHVEKVLGDLGLRVITVPEQREGNGDFPTVAFPNPEEEAALDMAISLGKKEGADVVMATDPDADRFGIAVPARSGAGGETPFVLVTGNQMGVLLGDYIFHSLRELGKLPPRPLMVNTVVTTGMQKRLAAGYGVDCVEVLTGFKWIADIMRKCDTGERGTFVFGTEESYGYLVENEVRDKDGISAAALCAEMTLYWRSKGKSLLDRLNELYVQYGYWQELGISKYFQGPEGPGIMKGIMEGYRKNPPKTLGGIAVNWVRDIKDGADGLPPSDVLQFFLEDGTVVSARPSGTEPKIKFYATCCAGAQAGLDAAKAEAARKLEAIQKDIRAVIDS
ncbi:MAG: phospho-sugar mutase [Treponema sp.]|jgi:phosphoglucomutase|nr:phospho-sugar mutase [Treponema sp.]